MGSQQKDLDLTKEWAKACRSFHEKTGRRLDQNGDPEANPNTLIAKLRAEKHMREEKNAKLNKVANVLSKTVDCLLDIGNALASVASTVLGPGQMCVNAVSFFVQAAHNYKKIFDDLDGLLDDAYRALGRFSSYMKKQNIIDVEMKVVASSILQQFVEVCAVNYQVTASPTVVTIIKATFFKGDSRVQDVMSTFNKMIDEEMQQRATHTYLSVKQTEHNVNDLKDQQSRGFKDVKEMKSHTDRDRQLTKVRERLGFTKSTETDLHKERYRNHMQSATSSTGQWLLDSHPFTSICQSDASNGPRLILLSGVEGSGKTFLISAIVQRLLRQFPQGNEDMTQTSIAYHYLARSQPLNKEAKADDVSQSCTMHAALRVLSYQVAENDPLYRKRLSDLASGSVDTTADVDALWDLLFHKTADGGTIYILVDGTHELDSQEVELDAIAKRIINQPTGSPCIGIISGRTTRMKRLAQELGSAASLIDVSSNNEPDIAAYIHAKVDSMPLLKREDGLREEICVALKDIAHGTYGHISYLLQQLRTLQRPGEMRDLLRIAREEGSDMMKSIERQIERCNKTLDAPDIDELNQLLDWKMASDWPLTLGELSGVRAIRRTGASETSLKPLFEKIHNEFSGFFLVKPDEDDPESEVSLVNETLREYFENKTAPQDDETTLSDSSITSLEVNIVQRFLRNLCDADLYQKFEFDQFFNRVAGSSSKVFVNTRDMSARVALDCLRLLLGETDGKATEQIKQHVQWRIISYLDEADISFISPKFKGEIGRRLVKLFNDEEAIAEWISERDIYSSCAMQHDCSPIIRKWLSDSAAMQYATAEDKKWIDMAKDSTKKGPHVYETIAVVAAKSWLLGQPGEDDQARYDILKISRPFQWVRYYLLMLETADDAAKELTWEDLNEYDNGGRLDTIIDWSVSRAGIKTLEYTSYVRIALTYQLTHEWELAEEMCSKALKSSQEQYVQVYKVLSRVYHETKRYELEIQALEKMVESYKKMSPTEGKEVSQRKSEFANCRREMAQLKSQLSRYDEAMAIFEELLREDPEDYRTIADLIELLTNQNKHQQLSLYFDELQTQCSGSTGHARLTQMLLNLAGEESIHAAIDKAAYRIQRTDMIQGIYEKALEVVAKTSDSETTETDMPYKAKVAHLKYNLANSLYRRCNNGIERTKALRFWEDVYDLEFPRSEIFAHGVWKIQYNSAVRLCLFYLSEARDAVSNPRDIEVHIQKAKSFKRDDEGDDVGISVEELRTMLAYHYVSTGQKDKARDQMKPDIEVAINWLSDDVDWNDHYGYCKLATSFLSLKDDVNALAAWSLVGPTKNIPVIDITRSPSNDRLTLQSQGSQTDADPTSIHNSVQQSVTGSTAGSNEALSEISKNQPDLDTRPPLRRSATSGLSKKPKGEMNMYCDCGQPSCGMRWTFPDDIMICRQCGDIGFAPECYEKMRRGELKKIICDPSHDFFYIPPWDFEKAARIGEGKVDVGSRVILVEDWLDEIRKDWGIEKVTSSKTDTEGVEDEAK